MLAPRSAPVLFLLSACAPVMSAAEHDAPYLAARATEAGACDATCCEHMAADLTAARAEGDDRIADELIERLALSCPDRRSGLLDPTRAPRHQASRERLHISVAYELRLPAEDQVTWAATYLDGTTRTLWPMPGPHDVIVDLHVLSGRDPGKGRLYRLTQTAPLAQGPGQWTGLVVKVTRREGAEPFALEVTATADPSSYKFPGVSGGRAGAVRSEGTIGLGNLSPGARRSLVVPHYERPDWKVAPVFYPPSELLLAGAPSEGFLNCVGPGGELLNSAFRGSWRSPPHPRLLGAALDWLRRFEYEKPDWAWQVESVCEPFDPAFDRSPAPRPIPSELGVIASFQYGHPPPR